MTRKENDWERGFKSGIEAERAVNKTLSPGATELIHTVSGMTGLTRATPAAVGVASRKLLNIIEAMWQNAEKECEEIRGENEMLREENERLRKAYLEPMAAALTRATPSKRED